MERGGAGGWPRSRSKEGRPANGPAKASFREPAGGTRGSKRDRRLPTLACHSREISSPSLEQVEPLLPLVAPDYSSSEALEVQQEILTKATPAKASVQRTGERERWYPEGMVTCPDPPRREVENEEDCLSGPRSPKEPRAPWQHKAGCPLIPSSRELRGGQAAIPQVKLV